MAPASSSVVRPARGILVLAISSLQSREEAMEAGASAFLQKPLAPLQLVSAIKDLLGESAYLRGDRTHTVSDRISLGKRTAR